MVKTSIMVNKTLVVGIIVLLIGMSVVSSNGYVIKRNHNYLENKLYESGSNGNNDTTPPVTNISLKGNMSKFGVFSSEVEVTLNATDDKSGVNVTYYHKDGGKKEIYYEPFMITGHGCHGIFYQSVDNAGNVENWKVLNFLIDLIPPDIDLTWEKLDNNSIKFNPWVDDAGSGAYKVEYYIDNEYKYTDYWNGSFDWIWNPPGWGNYLVSVIAYDRAENMAQDEIYVNVPRNRIITYSLFQLLFERFPNMEVFLRIMNLLR